MKLLVILLPAILIYSCAMREGMYKTKTGRIIIDKSGNGVYIPNDKMNKDLVSLEYKSRGDSIVIWSRYSKDHVRAEYDFKGQSDSEDSVFIYLYPSFDYPVGFVSVDFFDNYGNLVSRYLTLDKKEKIYNDPNIKNFQVNILGAKSELFSFKKDKGVLNIYFDHLSPNQLSRYTEIGEVIDSKEFHIGSLERLLN
jgi:hypothetical protein